MANTAHTNIVEVNATGDSGIGINKGDILLLYVIFTPNLANDEMELRDSSGGNIKFYIRGATAKDTKTVDLSMAPIRFAGAVHVEVLTSNAKAILVGRRLAR